MTNLQGDATAILDSTGAVMVNYHYDAYGVLLQTGGTMATTLGALNPLTYRGYVYDHETGLYYLQSRYYNPTIRQFISADAYISTGQGFLGYNMFAYCGNNPVCFADPTGTEFIDNDKDLLGGGGPGGPAVGYYGLSVGGGGYVPNTSAYVTNAVVGANAGGTPDTAVALLVVGALIWELISATNTAASIPNSDAQAKEKAEVIAITGEIGKKVYFPEDPHDFNPLGLTKVPRKGTKNGMLISWMNSITNTEVFRWDENPKYSNGPHYHIYGKGHYKPGDEVPFPYNIFYFPLG